MKRIYVVSLDDDVPLSPELVDNIKVLAYLVYEEIMNIEFDSDEKILLHDNVSRNELFETSKDGKYTHRFYYDNPETGLYEPFMLGDTAFAFTVNDGSLSMDDLNEAIKRSLVYIQECDINKYNIKSETYEEDPKNKNRLQAIKKILTGGNKEEKSPKKRTKSILSILF